MKPKLLGGITHKTVDEIDAQALLGFQKNLCSRQLRGDFQDLISWSSPAQVQADSVGFFIHRSNLCGNCIGTPQLGQPLRLPISSYRLMKTLREADFLADENQIDRTAGSGCLVSRNTVLTADHVVDQDFTDAVANGDLFFVLGFRSDANHGEPRSLEYGKHIFTVQTVVRRGGGSDSLDWAFVRLANEVGASRSIPKISSNGVKPGEPVYTLGHPNGLSLRYALSPNSARDKKPGCCRAYLDGYDAASGSPVFNGAHEIAGLMIETSFSAEGVIYTTAGDYLSLICSDDYETAGTLICSSENYRFES
jgi:hypothetical protein